MNLRKDSLIRNASFNTLSRKNSFKTDQNSLLFVPLATRIIRTPSPVNRPTAGVSPFRRRGKLTKKDLIIKLCKINHKLKDHS